MIGIYKITNLLNGKCYIGQSKNIEGRFADHKRKWKCECDRKSRFLYQAIYKYGIENFSFEVLEECEEKKLDELEIKYIAQYESFSNGYNMTAGGGGQHCREMSPEHKAALRKANTGRPRSEETRRKISETQKGKIIPEEQKRKMSVASKKKWLNPEYREKMCEIRRQRVITTETRQKISEASKGRTLSQETRRKISEKNKGRARTPEWREKQRKAHLGWHPTEETRKRMSEAQRGKVFSDEARKKLSYAAQNRTEEHQQKLRDCKKGGKNPMARAVECDGVVYETIAQCAEALGIPKSTLWRWLNGKPEMPTEYQERNLRYHQL